MNSSPDVGLGPVDLVALRLESGPVDLTSFATDATPGVDGRKAGEQALANLAPVLADLQERLWAARLAGSRQRVLVVLQGMDTSGKGGTIRKAFGLVDPRGLQITSFGAPTAEERARDFLWRIRPALPTPGHIGVFDRSHYEDVLIQRVRSFAPPEEIERRYGAIAEFEHDLAEDDVTVVKILLHISPEEQAERLRERLLNPAKHWKYDPSDLDDRALWDEYRTAHEIALERTDAEHAPWYVVPADRKWFRNLAVAQILAEALAGLDLDWPEADFDVAAQLARLDDVDISDS
ncbi:PPK2 family polyphosphate kinase [Nocardioides yefusunii]|uniref:PPK2 family polyphosphate kinase n=1 Tax=Nocardioides yefusunii TaxID=2500546 RepID=A0ABW1QWN2_9ACTN|nr:PPK2 family polyphosphate kinase [Nocardioides yefusunii]